MKNDTLDVAEMQDLIANRRMQLQQTMEKIDKLYENTDKMLTAIQNGTDADRCFEHWVTLIDHLEGFTKADKAFYTSHGVLLVELIENWFKAYTAKGEWRWHCKR